MSFKALHLSVAPQQVGLPVFSSLAFSQPFLHTAGDCSLSMKIPTSLSIPLPKWNAPVASFLFQGSAYTLYPELQSPSWPSRAMAFTSLLTMLLARLQGSLVFLCVQGFLPHPSQPDSPRILLTHHFPCRSSLPSSPLSRLRCESLNGNLYYTVSLLMTSLVTLSYNYISLSLLHKTEFLEHRSADCYRCLLCGYHSGLPVFNKQELRSTF